MSTAKRAARDWTPPAVYRFASRCRTALSSRVNDSASNVTVVKSDQGVPAHPQTAPNEEPPAWYDASFEAEAGQHFRKHYSTSRWYYIWAVIVDRLQATESPSVLDIGCGTGQVAAFIKDRGITAYVGFDFSLARLSWARSHVTGMRFEVANAYETDLVESVPYNVVVCLEFLEHVDRDLEVLGRLRPGVRFLGTVPNYGGGSHVRYFRNADEVKARYSSHFKRLRVDQYFMPGYSGAMQFLMDGIIANP